MATAGRRLADHVVAIASGKGGVGKSTITVNLATALAQRGLKVGMVDLDLYGPDIPVMLGLTRRRPAKHLDVWRAPDPTKPPEQPIDRFGVKVMSTQFLLAEEQTVAVDAPFAELLVDRMTNRLDWGPLDWLFIDLPPGTADLQQLVARRLQPDGVIVIVTPQDVAHLDAKKAITMFRQRRIPILGGVENMTGLTCPCCATALTIFPAVAPERSIWADGVKAIASIPIEPAIAEASERGTPVVVRDPDSEVARRFAALAEKLSAT